MKKLIFCILGPILFFMGCYTKTEGCLDVAASNFDVSADIACCCKYPDLRLSILNKYGLTDFDTDSIYFNAVGDSFRLSEFSYFLSGFSLQNELGQSFHTDDSLKFSSSGPEDLILPDDIILVRNGKSLYTLGTFKHFGEFSSVSFSLGLPAAISELSPEDFEEDHVLHLDEREMHGGSGFANLKMQILRFPETGPDTLFLSFYTDPIGLELSDNIELVAGASGEIRIALDFETLFGDIDVKTMTEDEIKMAIVTNLSSCFRLP